MVESGTTGGGTIASNPGLETSWRSLEIAGVIIAVLGVLGIFFPFVTGISVSLLLGGLLVVGGLVHIAHAFRARGWKGFIGEAILAIVYTFAGLTLLTNPVLGLTTLTLLLIAYFLLSGVVEAVIGFQIRGDPGWVWSVASGALSLVLGVLLWLGFPGTAAWAIGLLFGINLLSTGLAMFVIARGAHKQVTAGETGPETIGA